MQLGELAGLLELLAESLWLSGTYFTRKSTEKIGGSYGTYESNYNQLLRA